VGEGVSECDVHETSTMPKHTHSIFRSITSICSGVYMIDCGLSKTFVRDNLFVFSSELFSSRQ
jgi:hypothetical protein